MSETNLPIPPLVTIACICHNHRPFLESALHSVIVCGYSKLQIIIVDDASTDGSAALITKLIETGLFKSTGAPLTYFLEKNLGHNAAFNLALQKAEGKYIIDFALDDILIPGMLEKQIQFYEEMGKDAAFCYANAELINETGKFIRNFTDDPSSNFHSGHIFEKIIDGNFICPPSVVFKTDILKQEKGYDERLYFEDLDIWLRLSRKHPVLAFHQKVIRWRRHTGSMSYLKYTRFAEKQLQSIQLLLEKLTTLNQTKAEWKATQRLTYYYLRFACYTNQPHFMTVLYKFMVKHQIVNPFTRVFHSFKLFSPLISRFYKLYFGMMNHCRY